MAENNQFYRQSWIKSKTVTLKDGLVRQWLQNQEIDMEYFECYVCKKILWEPQFCGNCGIQFCKKCSQIDQDKKIICPGEECEGFQSSNNKIIRKRLNDLQFVCPFIERGCFRKDIRYQEFEKHLNTCHYRLLPVNTKFQKIEIYSRENKPGDYYGEYVAYKLKNIINNEECLVERRFSQFYDLNQYLLEKYPGTALPPLPSKSFSIDQFSDQLLEEREISLELYLEILAENQDLENDEALNKFMESPEYDLQMMYGSLKDMQQGMDYIKDKSKSIVSGLWGMIKQVKKEDTIQQFKNDQELQEQQEIQYKQNQSYSNSNSDILYLFKNLPDDEKEREIKKKFSKISMYIETLQKIHDNLLEEKQNTRQLQKVLKENTKNQNEEEKEGENNDEEENEDYDGEGEVFLADEEQQKIQEQEDDDNIQKIDGGDEEEREGKKQMKTFEKQKLQSHIGLMEKIIAQKKIYLVKKSKELKVLFRQVQKLLLRSKGIYSSALSIRDIIKQIQQTSNQIEKALKKDESDKRIGLENTLRNLNDNYQNAIKNSLKQADGIYDRLELEKSSLFENYKDLIFLYTIKQEKIIFQQII